MFFRPFDLSNLSALLWNLEPSLKERRGGEKTDFLRRAGMQTKPQPSVVEVEEVEVVIREKMGVWLLESGGSCSEMMTRSQREGASEEVGLGSSALC